MLKLTYHDSGETLYISAKYIVALGGAQRGVDATIVFLPATSLVVTESVEAILAMPEMVYQMSSMMVVGDAGSELRGPSGPSYAGCIDRNVGRKE